MRFVLLSALVTACTSSSPGLDAGPDATADVVSSDANDSGVVGCDVQTCSGPTFLLPGQTVPVGDGCGDTCTCQAQGGLLTSHCTFTNGCPCPTDAGTD